MQLQIALTLLQVSSREPDICGGTRALKSWGASPCVGFYVFALTQDKCATLLPFRRGLPLSSPGSLHPAVFDRVTSHRQTPSPTWPGFVQCIFGQGIQYLKKSA